MLISTAYRFIFVHVPKTGGSSITATLAPYLDNPKPVNRRRGWLVDHQRGFDLQKGQCRVHVTPAELPPPEGFLVAGFVRNPYTRMISLWRNLRWDDEDPDAFTARWFRGEVKRVAMPWWQPQTYWFREVEKPMVGRFENLQGDFDKFCKRVGLPELKLCHWNIGQYKGSGELSPASKVLVAKHWAEDFERWGYDL